MAKVIKKEIEKKIKAINKLSGMFIINNKNYIKTINGYTYIIKAFEGCK